MKYNHVYTPRAASQYEEALMWYDSKSTKARINFEDAILNKINEICTHPKLYRNPIKYFREAVLVKYPFSIIYFIDEKARTIVITSVFHQSRDPKKKYK